MKRKGRVLFRFLNIHVTPHLQAIYDVGSSRFECQLDVYEVYTKCFDFCQSTGTEQIMMQPFLPRRISAIDDIESRPKTSVVSGDYAYFG